MRPERLYTAGSRSRRARSWPKSPPVTVIAHLPPELVRQTEQRPSARARVWTTAKTIGPALVAVTALIISLFSYEDQHGANQRQEQADSASVASREQQQAALISFWQTGSGQSWTLTAENRSADPVSAIFKVVLLEVTADNREALNFDLSLRNIPPCSIAVTHPWSNSLSLMERLAGAAQPDLTRSPDFIVQDMTYNTSAGTFSANALGGSVIQLNWSLNNFLGKMYQASTFPAAFKPSDGCS